MKKWKKDLVTSIVFLVVTAIYYSQTFKIRQTTLISITSTFIPRLCVLGMVILSLLMGFRSIKARRAEKGQSSSTATKADYAEVIGSIVAFTVLFIGVFLIENVGFVYGSFTYLIVSFITLGVYEDKKNWVVRIIISIVAPIVIYIFFYNGFHLSLPSGFLGLFGGIL